MSRQYFIACEDYLDLEAFQALVQRHLGEDTKLCLKLQEQGYSGQFYIENQSIRGITITQEEENLVVHIPLLADYADFFLGKLFLDIFHQFLSAAVLDEDGDEVDVREHFSDENVQQLRNTDAQLFWHMLKNMDSSLTLSCVTKDVVFGKAEADHFLQCQLDFTELAQRLTTYLGGALWGDAQEDGSAAAPESAPDAESLG